MRSNRNRHEAELLPPAVARSLRQLEDFPGIAGCSLCGGERRIAVSLDRDRSTAIVACPRCVQRERSSRVS